MRSVYTGSGARAVLVGILAWLAMGDAALAYGATRDLSAFSEPGVPFTTTIVVDAPPDATMAGLEDAPPVGWAVSNISDGGTWDAENAKVKWGLFLEPPFPSEVTYDVTPSAGVRAEYCFEGTVTFVSGTQYEPVIGGDQCISFGAPAVSAWGAVIMTLIGAVAGAQILPKNTQRW